LVLEPAAGQSISRILQSLMVAHTWHYHQQRGTSGQVWQGRFKSPVIEADEQLLTVLRYVEANPLRAGMVSDLAAYPWSARSSGDTTPEVPGTPYIILNSQPDGG
jgi:putative transposase